MGGVITPRLRDKLADFYRENYVFGFPCFRIRLIDFYKENQMDLSMEAINFGCGCRAVPLDESGTTWSLKHCQHCHDTVPAPAPALRYRPISAHELETMQRQLRDREDAVLKTKGHDYTGGGPDRLANFIEDGEALGISPEMAWAVHFRKQVAAVMTWATTGRIESESLSNRFVDIRNYCLLGLALREASRPTEEGRGVV